MAWSGIPRMTGKKSASSLDDDRTGPEKWLDSQPDGSFEPAIGDYETFLGSLRIAGIR